MTTGKFYVEGKKGSISLAEIQSTLTEIQDTLTEIQDTLTGIESTLTEIQSALTEIQATLTEIQSTLARVICSMDLWSGFGGITVDAVATTYALPSITIAGLPSGISIVKAAMMLKFRAMEELSGTNSYLDGNQQVQAQKAIGGTWIASIQLLDKQLRCPSLSREFGDVLIGNIDIKAQLPANNEAMEFRWLSAKVLAGSSIRFEDLQVGVRVWFSVGE